MNTKSNQDEKWMLLAIEQAELAAESDEVPVGAILVEDGKLLAAASNCPIGDKDPTAHAEILALRRASQIKQNYRLPGTTLYVTIEPCTMCVGAMIHARIQRLVIGAKEPRAGAVLSQHRLLDSSIYNHQIEYDSGVKEEACSSLLQDFFRAKRAKTT